MSDEGEIDVESDDVAEGGDVNEDFSGKCLDKRAHHNALERKRRDHIKDSFTNLRDCIPSLSGEKVSRAHVLNKATEYIREMQRNSAVRSMEIDELKKKNEILEEQVNALEQAQEIGSSENPEDLIASIAEKVQQRQSLRQQQQQQQQQQQPSFTNKSKVQLEPAEPSDKSSSSEPVSQPSSINILANNIRTTQNLLSALAKNLPTNSSNSQMRSIAARVLASPLRPQVGSTSTSTPPRGVVTATTVPLLAATNEPVKVLSVETINSLAGGMPPSSNVATTVSTGANISDGVVLVSEGDNNLLTSEDKEPPSKRLKTELEC